MTHDDVVRLRKCLEKRALLNQLLRQWHVAGSTGVDAGHDFYERLTKEFCGYLIFKSGPKAQSCGSAVPVHAPRTALTKIHKTGKPTEAAQTMAATISGEQAAATSNSQIIDVEKEVLEAQTLVPPDLDISFRLGYTHAADEGVQTSGASLYNLGNTCYLNALLQAMTRVPALRQWCCQHQVLHRGATPNEIDGCVLCNLACDVRGLLL